MTPAQIDTVTNGLINLHTFVADHGPGLLAAAIAVIGWCVIWRQLPRQTRQETAAAQGIQRLEQYANDPTTRRLLDDIHNQPREEEL